MSDGRKYEVGDKVMFTDDSGKQVPGVVHGVRYQMGRYQLVNSQRPDMNLPEGPDNPTIPGSGTMEIIPGTENEHHSFEYIMVHENEHKAWHDVEKDNQKKLKRNNEVNKRNQVLIDKHKGSVRKDLPFHLDNFKDMPQLEGHEGLTSHPELKQHVREYVADD